MDPLDDEPAAGDGVQQPQLQKPEDLFLDMCESYRILLMEILTRWPLPASEGELARPSMTTAACRQQMVEWWHKVMVTNTGFSLTRVNDKNEREREKLKAFKGGQRAQRGTEGLVSTGDP